MLTEKLQKLGLSSEDMKGKVVLITGAGQGIGKELALAMSRLGASVVIAEIKDYGAKVEAQIKSEGGSALFVRIDVSDDGSVKALADKAVKEFGKVDVVINNAAVEYTGSVLEQPVIAWERAYAVNTIGPLRLIKAFLPGMLQRKGGVLVNVLSAEGMPYLAPYAASKAALQSMTTSLVAELGENSGVSVFTFAPGMVDTPGANSHIPQVAPRLGMTFEQFTHMGVNPGYEGLMPAEDCAAGFAYAIVHAKEYHGQGADAFLPLMRAGLINAGGMHVPGETAPAKEKEKEKPSVAAAVAEAKMTPAGAVELSKGMQNVIEAINKETEELDLFKRTWVKNDFGRRNGMSIKDWQKTAADLIADLEELARTSDAAKAGAIKTKFPVIISRAVKLEKYIQSSAENAKNYFKDPVQRETALEALAQREKAVTDLVKALKELS
ncbi:SDR family NAD(P)-dependent oxidoreductase [Methanocella sp. MCL-LM]|uniref:SDR family NAD(P)-dependent oxidoreductase n=1 Tax=Methanocella sp. MCL-LM TaxID=3412035 RepID=UPI003C730A2E